MQQTFHILTFGCQMNFNDSFWLERALIERGFIKTDLSKATVIILNTCSVREKPEQKVYNSLRKIAHETRNTKGAFVVVAGCVAQQIGVGFFDKFKQVRLVSGGDGIGQIPASITKLFHEPQLKISLIDFSESYPEREHALGNALVSPISYVNIMQGCDNFCAYCIVPYTRGPQKSRSTSAILEECVELIAKGSKEICLLGQNVNSFGQDASGDGTSFANLLYKISALPGLARLRFMTPHPKDFSPEVIKAFAELENLCPHVHLPLQAGSNSVLSNMGRKYTKEHFLYLVQELRKVRPEMSFSSDIIVGFPGESEEDFLQTLEMLEQVNFRASFSFCYSDRPNTKASQLPIKVDKEVSLDRLQRLQAKQDELGIAWLKKREGQDTILLLEDISKKSEAKVGYAFWQGRDPHGVTVNVCIPENIAKKGLLLPVRIIEAKRHTLVGEFNTF